MNFADSLRSYDPKEESIKLVVRLKRDLKNSRLSVKLKKASFNTQQ